MDLREDKNAIKRFLAIFRGHPAVWIYYTARSIFEPILRHELCDYPIRAQQTFKTSFTLYDYEAGTGSVYQLT